MGIILILFPILAGAALSIVGMVIGLVVQYRRKRNSSTGSWGYYLGLSTLLALIFMIVAIALMQFGFGGSSWSSAAAFFIMANALAIGASPGLGFLAAAFILRRLDSSVNSETDFSDRKETFKRIDHAVGHPFLRKSNRRRQ